MLETMQLSIEMGIGESTLYNWRKQVIDKGDVVPGDGNIKTDARPRSQRPKPKNKLSEAERESILAIIHSDDFKSLPPSKTVSALADNGVYIASESTYYRVLHEEKLQNAR